VAQYLTPPLTTVRLPFEATGVRAAALLLDLIGRRAWPQRQLLPVELVVRSSTRPPGSAHRGRNGTRGTSRAIVVRR